MKLLLRVSFTVATLKTFRIRGFAAGKATTEKCLVSFNAVIKRLCGEGRIREAETVLQEMTDPDCVTYNTLISAACEAEKNHNLSIPYVRIVELYHQMCVRELSPNETTYRCMIRLFCDRNRVEEAVGILRLMAEKGLSPHADSYSRIISRFCINKEMGKALEMKVEMLDKGIFPDVHAYVLLIQLLCHQRRLLEARDLFQEMLLRGMSPGGRTYDTLVEAYCLKGEFSKVFHLQDEVIQKGFLPYYVTSFSPSLVTYNALIHGLCFFQRPDEALEILRGMPEMLLDPDEVSYSAVISGFRRIRELRKAFELKLEMDQKETCWPLDQDTNESLVKDLSNHDTFSSLVNDYCAEDKAEMAFKLRYQAQYLPDSVSYCLLLNGLHKKATSRFAKRLLLFYIVAHCLTIPSYIIYDILIEKCANNEFKSVVELVKGFRMRGLVNEAARARDTMLHRNYKPEGAVYNLLIFDHCIGGNVHKAYDMYKEMLHYGFVCHMFSVLALIKALYCDERYNEMSWVIRNTLRSCNLNDSEQLKILDEIDPERCIIYALLDVLAEKAMDGLLLDGGKCSYASASCHGRFTPTTMETTQYMPEEMVHVTSST
ncbi:pentatricopeptide repeat-containing protein At5g39710-like [Lotus japonicus]|uniref:pentatricopeptide repeat-containing protein At5g39710-like n=1 Tax=Lotus japonicus TaxID=34305 RepID=UPI002584C05E|nr:pentatricopeptide repeat-containing protein At5g39710-like [Lotus japonicus]